MSGLSNQLVIAERDEVARGIRLLLASPLVSERLSAEAFDVIRRRHEPIKKWFDYYCGWSVVLEPRLGYARLVKVRPAVDSSRPARRLRSSKAPFDRRRYVLLCVVAAELLPVPVTTIGLLAERVRGAIAADPVISDFDSSQRAERMAFVDALRLLESYGAIEAVDGATETFVDTTTAKVLYRVDATLLMRLLATPVGASQLGLPVPEVPAQIDELLTLLCREQRYGAVPDQGGAPTVSETQRNLWLRHSVFRRLVDDPVVYLDDLPPAQRSYLSSPTGRQLLRRAAEQAGFLLEERAEGIMLVDPDAIATDGTFPDDSATARVAALLLLDVLNAAGATTTQQLRAEADRLLERHPRWAKTYRSHSGPDDLVADAVAVLRDFGLVRLAGSLVHPLPAAARYAVGATRTSAARHQGEESP